MTLKCFLSISCAFLCCVASLHPLRCIILQVASKWRSTQTLNCCVQIMTLSEIYLTITRGTRAGSGDTELLLSLFLKCLGHLCPGVLEENVSYTQVDQVSVEAEKSNKALLVFQHLNKSLWSIRAFMDISVHSSFSPKKSECELNIYETSDKQSRQTSDLF